MTGKNTKSSLHRSLFGLTLIAGVMGICAIANLPNLSNYVSNYLPCVMNCEARAANELLNYNRAIASLLNLKTLDKRAITLVVEKSKYRLTVYYQNKPVKAYAIALGGNPRDDKLQQGDRRTPEGIFRVRELYYHSQWSKFIWLDYPNQDSWRKFLFAKSRGIVAADADIGGEIGIHGVDKGNDWLIDRRINWTLGCVSLKNKDVDEIYPLLQRGTTVQILR